MALYQLPSHRKSLQRIGQFFEDLEIPSYFGWWDSDN